MIDADFEGGSLDNVEDAIAQLDRSKWPPGVDVAALLREAHARFRA